jgi:hypothetical protein
MKNLFRRPRLQLCLLGLLLGGCMSAAGPSKDFAKQPSGFEVELHWGTPSRPADPLTAVSVGSVTSPFLVDTGTSELLITEEFAQRAGLLGGAQGFRREPLVYQIGGRPYNVDRFLVIEAPPLQAEGWGGIYSPQLLTTNTTVVLDFPRLKMTSITPAVSSSSAADSCRIAVDGYMASHHSGRPSHRLAWRGRSFGAVLVEGGLVGKPSILLDVDTGKAVSAFRPSYIGPASASGKQGPRMVDIHGVEQSTTVVPGQALQLGSLILSDRSVAAHDTGGKLPDGTAWDGNLGMDILKDAIIVLCPIGDDAIYIGVR